jgi:hypothetical protein
MKIRNNREHIRSTWSSLLLTSLLTTGIHAEEIFEYGTFLIGYEKYSWLRYCITREIPGLIPSRVHGNFKETYSSLCIQ